MSGLMTLSKRGGDQHADAPEAAHLDNGCDARPAFTWRTMFLQARQCWGEAIDSRDHSTAVRTEESRRYAAPFDLRGRATALLRADDFAHGVSPRKVGFRTVIKPARRIEERRGAVAIFASCLLKRA
jgi:hypothetical protein